MDDLNLKIPGGKVTALVGLSGGGAYCINMDDIINGQSCDFYQYRRIFLF